MADNRKYGNPDQSVSTATITFAEDGDYTLSVSGKDKAANQAETVKQMIYYR